MKYVKTFESFTIDAKLNETVYSTGLGGNLAYSSVGASSVKLKTVSILKSNEWKNTEAGKFAVENAKRLADEWNSEDPSKLPAWAIKEWTTDNNNKFKESNFLKDSAMIVSILDIISKRENVKWISAGGARNQCFQNAINWGHENKGKAIGGVCLPKDMLGKYYADQLIVHAFAQKNKSYYEVTFPLEKITKETLYWPLIEFDGINDSVFSKEIWSYAIGIEEGVKEYKEKHYS